MPGNRPTTDDADMDSEYEVSPELAAAFRRLDQRAIFESTFKYVRTNMGKADGDRISISDILSCLMAPEANASEKFHLGWSAICMIRQRQHHMDMTNEELRQITQMIVDKMTEDENDL